MDYDKLLDLWAEKIYKESDKAMKISENAEIGSYKYGYSKGYSDGLLMATSILNRMERWKGKK